MTRFEHYLSGKVFGIKYVFETIVDGLPRHQHDAVTAHNIVVTRGEIKVLFDDRTVYLVANDVFDFDGSRWHEIKATKPNSAIINFFLNGQPTEYQQLPPHELKGEFDVRTFRR